MPCFVCFNLLPKRAELILCFQLKICNRLLLGNTPPFHFFSSFIASCNSDSSLPCELRATISTYALKPFLPVFLACHPWSWSVLTCQSYRLARCSCSTESFIHVPWFQILPVLLATFLTPGNRWLNRSPYCSPWFALYCQHQLPVYKNDGFLFYVKSSHHYPLAGCWSMVS